MGLQDRDYMRNRPESHSDEFKYLYNPKLFRQQPTSQLQPPVSVSPIRIHALFKISLLLLIITLLTLLGIEYKRLQPFPETGHARWFIDPNQGEKSILKIEAPKSQHIKYVVQLNSVQTGKTVVQISVNAGETAVTVVPMGQYEVVTHKGVFWQGNQYMFGIAGQKQKMEGTLSFFQTHDQVMGQRLLLDASFMGLNASH